MIIKRNLKSKMPTLKRCKVVGESGFEDEQSPWVSRKRKTNGYNYNPLDLLSEVAAGRIPVTGFGFRPRFGDDGEEEFSSVGTSWCSEVSYCPHGEVESEARRREGWRVKNHNAEVFRPPLVKTARGRVQVLPSRFNDSVLDPWKKETTKTIAPERIFTTETSFCKKDKFNSKILKFDNRINKKQRKEDQFPNSLHCTRKKKQKKRDEEEEMGNLSFKSFDIRKYTSSLALTSLHASAEVEKSPPLIE